MLANCSRDWSNRQTNPTAETKTKKGAPSSGQPKPTIEDCLKELKLDLAKSKKELNLPHDGEEASPWDEYIAPWA